MLVADSPDPDFNYLNRGSRRKLIRDPTLNSHLRPYVVEEDSLIKSETELPECNSEKR